VLTSHAIPLLGTLVLLAAAGLARGQGTTLQGAALLKTDLMFVGAHPDDETGAAATLAYYARGRRLTVATVYCTRGEGGGNMVGTQSGAALGLLREVELRDALSILGVRHLFFLDQLDFAYTESLAATLHRWNREESLRRLVRLYRTLRPEVVITMNPAPVPGQHGHHQAAGVLATEAFDAAADPARFPEQLRKEGLTPWQPRKLYYGGGSGASIRVDQPMSDGRTPADVAAQALVNHRSQAFGAFVNAPFMRRPQGFTLARSFVGSSGSETDLAAVVPALAEGAAPVLFSIQPTEYRVPAGERTRLRWRVVNLRPHALSVTLRLSGGPGWSPGAGESRRLAPDGAESGELELGVPVNARGAASVTGLVTVGSLVWTQEVPLQVVAPLTLEIDPRPAIAWYRGWAARHGVEHAAATLVSDLPITAGEPAPVTLRLRNRGRAAVAGEARIIVPAGWKVVPPSQRYRSTPGGSDALLFQVTSPPTPEADATFRAVTSVGSERAETTANLHPVPRRFVPRLRAAPALDGTGRGWERVEAQEIGPTRLVEGRVRDPADSSALFRLGYLPETLFVDVDVRDDRVVSNIEPNDIRGHWRSDSVEICVDPDAGREDTFRCLKLGIFPFDTTGRVRAARDADENQGPIEETAPGLRVVSRRTPGGYRIQAAIPFRLLHRTGAPGLRLAFNVIVYDGDKPDAARGENINKSRIAWSPRPGVQGRPEDWGRIVLR
jgi:LmbE family N-acetylglucosaminyl deacetylase